MIDVLLINIATPKDTYGELADELIAIEPPVWPRIIAGYLTERGHTVKIFNMAKHVVSDVHAAVYVHRPKIVALCVYGHQPSASTQNMPGARWVAKRLKEYGYDGTIVIVGNHPSALPIRTLHEEPVDYVINGEGPVTLDELLKGMPLPTIPGLVYHPSHCAEVTIRDAYVKANGPAPLIDISHWYPLGWDLVGNLSQYRAHMWQCLDGSPRSPYASVYTTLGCPYLCDFCMINTFQHTNKYRMRDPEDVITEFAYLYKQGVTTFKIVDELFVLNRKHYYAICKGLADLNVKDEFNIWAYSRPDTVTKDDLPLLRAAGIQWLALGIESGNEAVRDGANRKMKKTKSISQGWDIYKTVREIQAAGINVIGNYIFGLPDDTLETMQETLDTAIWLNTEFANFYCAMPYPGSPLYTRVSRDRPEDLPPSWDAYSQHSRSCRPLRNANLRADEILQFRDRAFQHYFTTERYRKNIQAKFGIQALKQIDKMLSYKIERDLLNV